MIENIPRRVVVLSRSPYPHAGEHRAYFRRIRSRDFSRPAREIRTAKHPRATTMTTRTSPFYVRAVRRSRETRGHWLRENLPPPPDECADRQCGVVGGLRGVARKGCLVERQRKSEGERKREIIVAWERKRRAEGREKDVRRAREKDGAHEIHGILIRHPARVPKTNPRRSEPASAYLG